MTQSSSERQKKRIYFLLNSLSLMLAKLRGEPLSGWPGTLATVASLKPTTEGHYIRRHSTRAIGVRQSYPVISMGFMEYSIKPMLITG